MKKKLTLIILLFAVSYTYAQDTTAVKRDALKMMNALTQGDYNTFADYNHPNALSIMGGRENVISTTKSAMENAEKKGMSMRGGILGAVGKFVVSENQIYCTIPDTIMINVEGGYAAVPSTLLGISSDQGKNWTFISTGNYPRETLIQYFPNLPKDIVIPPKGRVVVHKD